MEEKALYEFYVAGVQFHDLCTCINDIKVDDTLILRAEPTNKFDPNAVRVEFNLDGHSIMLGYVPAKGEGLSAKVSAKLEMNPLLCKVLEINPEAKTWERLKVGIFNLED